MPTNKLALSGEDSAAADSSGSASDHGAKSGSPPSKGPGGPRTAAGKVVASRNARRHGILSPDPIAGNETLDDWIAFHAGVHTHFSPSGAYEEECVWNIASDMWSLRRVARQISDLIDLRFEQIDPPRIPELEQPHRSYRNNNDARQYARPYEAIQFLEVVDSADDECELDLAIAHDCCRAIAVIAGATPSMPEPESPVTVGHMRAVIAQAATTSGRAKVDVVNGAISRLEIASVPRRSAQIKLRDKMKEEQREAAARAGRAARSHLPDPDEYDTLLRYKRAHEKSLEGWVAKLENSQRARTGSLPPPVRVDVRAA